MVTTRVLLLHVSKLFVIVYGMFAYPCVHVCELTIGVLCVCVCVRAGATVHVLVMVFDDDGVRASMHASVRGHQHSSVDVKLRLLHI